MDAVLLSRIQFGVAAGFHFIFPPLTLGLTLIIFILETLYIRRNDDLYRTISSFVIKLLGLIFTLGVATGIALEFSFGTNWSEYSRVVGDIFGAPLAAEGIFAFFLESVFIGVLLFGRDRVSKRVFWLSSLLVCFASHFSAFWIIIANSWMQTPAGYKIDPATGRAMLDSLWDAAFNPSTVIRFIHTIIASWISGALFAGGISAWYILKERHLELFKPLLRISMILFVSMALLQFGSGHSHSVQVANLQPGKMAAFEALWKTPPGGAPMSLFGIPVESERKTYLEIAVPGMLSLFAHFDPDHPMKGLDAVPEEERPPVFLPYVSYHVMIGLGSLFALLALAGGFLLYRGTLYTARRFLRVLIFAVPLPLIANEFGWIAAEVGRQPWAVYRILKTSKAASVVVPAGQVLFTLIMFCLLYLLLFAVFLLILKKIVEKGPAVTGPMTAEGRN